MPLAVLTRHGLSEHNLDTRFYMGRSPGSRLTDAGRAQAEILGQRLARDWPVSRIVASSLPRCLETASIVAARAGIREVHPDEAFWELSKGDWEGRMPRAGVPAALQQELDADPFHFRFPGGESFADVQARVVPAFRRWELRGEAESVLYVLHGDVLAALFQHLLGFPPERVRDYLVAPCSVTRFGRVAGSYRLLGYNENPAAG
jgi:probable phosphoglycerate mutase